MSEKRAMKNIVIAVVLTISCGICEGAGLGTMEKSVVMIRSAGQEFDYVTPWKPKAMAQGVGSGFIIDGNRVMTNAHNVSNNKYVELQKEGVAKRFPARVAFIGHDCDLAILEVGDSSFFNDTIALNLADLPGINTTVSTYGFPIGGRHISVTEGVVSRIQLDTYSHTGADSHLVIQTDAAINPGNSGGPVMQEGSVVGVAFQGLRQADNIGYMIPTTVMTHFLKDIEDGTYDGFGSLGVMLYQGLHNESYREYLKAPPEQEGIVIIETLMHSSVETILQKNDVLVQIDNYKIDNDGRVEIYGLKLDLSEAIETKQIGDAVEIQFYRGGELKKASAKVALNRPVFEFARQYDISPRYVCFAGLVFVPATRNYLETWGHEWMREAPFYLRYLFRNSMQLNKDRQRREYVVLSEIMADKINAYAGKFKSQVIESINGTPIWALDDVWNIYEKAEGDFWTIKFMGMEQPMIIDAKTARERQADILRKYDIPQEKMLEDEK
ncbi:MAG: trypsin-like peptidase domain-containing protein [Sedimentisphaerales bacterium]|nr:trypsin-like peptidase domain-containing protein [Sedimentisphaerales bacterium]